MDDNDLYTYDGGRNDSFDGGRGDLGDREASRRRSSGSRSSGSRQQRHSSYVRQPKPRRTQEAIDNLEQDDSYAEVYAHDSNVSSRGGMSPLTGLSGLDYHRSRHDMGKLQRDLHYGQYLEVPKGRRQIFQSRQRAQQIRSRANATLVVVALVIIAICVWKLITLIP